MCLLNPSLSPPMGLGPLPAPRAFLYPQNAKGGAAVATQEAKTMSWNEAREQADKMQIEGPTPHRVHVWAQAIRDALEDRRGGDI